MALDATLPVYIRRMPYPSDNQLASQRLLDIVDRRRSFEDHNAGERPHPLPPNLRWLPNGFSSFSSSSSSDGSSSGARSRCKPYLDSSARQLSLRVMQAGTVALNGARQVLGEPRQHVQTQGVRSVLA